MITVDFAAPEALELQRVGGKTVGLARMTQNGMSVAPGFAVTTAAHRDFLQRSGINQRIRRIVDEHDVDDAASLAAAAEKIAVEFAAVTVPDETVEEISRRYRELADKVGVDDVSVAVRSSATAEDTADSSFAGEYETYLGVTGAGSVVDHVKLCWASAFTPHAIRYALDRGMSPLDVSMAVVVQKVVKARSSGVMFTLSPTTGDRSRIVIEASWGVGLAVVGGEVTPDRFAVDKIKLELIDKKLGDKRIEYVDSHTSTPVDAQRQALFALSDIEAIALARLGKALERLHGAAQDIEFAVDSEMPEGENVVLLQCRPETVWSVKQTTAPPTGSVPLMDRISESVFGVSTGTVRTAGIRTLPKGGHEHG